LELKINGLKIEIGKWKHRITTSNIFLGRVKYVPDSTSSEHKWCGCSMIVKHRAYYLKISKLSVTTAAILNSN
jgi:hypothetical protein